MAVMFYIGFLTFVVENLLLEEISSYPFTSSPIPLLYRTIITGWRRALTNDDIWAIRDEDSTQNITPGFEKNWEEEKKKASPKLSLT